MLSSGKKQLHSDENNIPYAHYQPNMPSVPTGKSKQSVLKSTRTYRIYKKIKDVKMFYDRLGYLIGAAQKCRNDA
jgi:hypothetical protein